MTCAKRRVIAIISDDAGRVSVGENTCANPQKVCPRAEGEDYSKCKTVCKQECHAEVDALNNWFMRYSHGLPPSHALIRGHHYACDHCIIALKKAGVKTITFGEERIAA